MLASQVINSYVPKIGEYFDDLYQDQYPGIVNEFTASVLDDDEYIQGNVISTKPKQIGDDPASWIYTWGAFDDDSAPRSIGISFTEEALEEMFVATDPDGEFPQLVPHLATEDFEPPGEDNQFDAARVYDLSFPDMVVEKTPFNHMGWYANAEGHAPTDIFALPHVDVHFFNISLEERKKIDDAPVFAFNPDGTPGSDPKYANFPPPGFLPEDYITFVNDFNENPPQFFSPVQAGDLGGEGILPLTADLFQGVHWVDKDAPPFQPTDSPDFDIFGQVFIFGTYDGEVNFWEPMVTKDFLESLGTPEDGFKETEKRTFEVKQPTRFLEDGFYLTGRSGAETL